MKIAIDKIQPSPEPIRKSMEPARLDELAQSIKEQGLIVPIKVRPNGTGFEIVYGHRRFAAAQMAGLDEVEAIVEGLTDDDTLIQALIENVVREDMNDADKRDALLELKERTKKTWAEIAAIFGWGMKRTQWLASMTDEEADFVRSSSRGKTHRHVEVARQAGAESLSVLEKAEREDLSQRATAKVAEAVAAAKDPRRKQRLLDREYDPHYHNKEYVEWREKQYWQHDPELKSKAPPKDDDWRKLPEVVMALEYPKQTLELVEKTRRMGKAGKFAPEAQSFIGRRWLKVIEKIDGLLDDFGVADE